MTNTNTPSRAAAVITVSDKGFRGEREDKSAPAIVNALPKAQFTVAEQILLPDDFAMLKATLIRLSDEVHCELILTTGGTGFSKRDITPEATLAVAQRNAPGIAEGIRAYSMTITKRAMLSRGVSVIRGNTLIVNLPGSPKAVRECMEFLGDTLVHGLDILTGRDGECAR